MKQCSRDQQHTVRLTLNGAARSAACEPRMLLSDFLREGLGATGTHVGCEHGVCGACTVQIDGVAGRSCLTLALQVDGRRVDTVEGLCDADGPMSDLQQAFKRHHALQCGFCTAGILMSCDDYLQRVPGQNGNDVEGKRDTRSVDAMLSYKVNGSMTISLEGINLTDTFNQQYVDSYRDSTSVYHHTGREYYLGLRYKF